MSVMSCSFTIRRRNGREHVVLYSPEDEELIQAHRWGLCNTYAATDIPRGDGTHYRLYLHRAILNIPRSAGRDVQGDHINGNRLDNRRKNLRITDAAGNARNRLGSREGYQLIDMDVPIG